MATLSYVDVGVDISKHHLDFYLHQVKKAFRISNSAEGIHQLKNVLMQYTIGQIVCESTGGYETLLCNTMQQSNYKMWCVEPKRIKAFITSEGIKAKTDKIDAKMIALFASQKQCAYEQIQISEDNKKLKNLVAVKAIMTENASVLKTQLKQFFDKDSSAYLKRQLRSLEKDIEKISNQINMLIKSNQEFENKAEIMTSIPGIGKTTAATFLAFLPEMGKVNNKAAAALVGVAPYVKQSGCYKGKARISGGRSQLRKVLYMAALSAIMHNPKLKVFYKRLIDDGKAHKVAMVAVMRKLVTYMNTLVKKGEKWNVVT
jgi:transposase